MTDFKAKMHQIRFRLGLRPRPCWWSLQRSPDPLAGFEGPISREGGEGWNEKGAEGREEGRGGRRKEGRGGLSDNVAEDAFCLKSAPGGQGQSGQAIKLCQAPAVLLLP